mmetsp:Transcript_6979/g.6160  ORF Transcript_6979/g.6160 Transcript_6979/m.6160 type:complete len:183 (-) Transcript_6979:472-1020(-)
MVIHSLVLLLEYPCKNGSGKCANFIKFIKKIFNLTLYIRFLLFSYMFSLLANLNESYNMDLTSKKRNFSTLVAVSGVCIQLIFLFFVYFIGKVASSQDHSIEDTSMSEFIIQAKKGAFSSQASFMHLSRIFITILWVLCAESTQNSLRISVFTGIQIFFFFLKLCIRPFKNIHANIIEIMND